jgi:urease accessory protein
MILIETVLGNAADPDWSERVAAGRVDTLELDHWEAQKSRLRKRSAGGVELAISLERNSFLRDGDVLRWDAEAQTPAPSLILVRLRLRDVMVIELGELTRDLAGPDAPAALAVALRTCVELGHALGNQHWPALVKGTKVLVPLTVDRQVMHSVMKTHGFEGIRYDFVPGSDIVPYLAPHESRRLFGAAEGPVHSHTHDHA